MGASLSATKRRPSRAATTLWPVIALSIALMLVTRTFQYFPGMGLVQEAGIVAAPVALAILVMRHRRVVGRTRGFELYVLFLMVAMPAWSGVAALSAYGQPLFFGVLAWRGYWLSAFALLVLYAGRARLITTSDVDRAFVACAWATLTLFLLMTLLLVPANFIDYGPGFIEDRHTEGYRFKFNAVFTIYAMFHYAVRALRESRPQWYLASAPFALFLFGSAGGRTLTVSVILAVLVVLLHWGGWARVWRGAAGLAVLLIVVIGVAAVSAPAATSERLDKFADAFAVFSLDADLIDDASAASRALQVLVALPMIEEHPFVGNGRISSQWVDDGYSGYLNTYFFPDDIGVLGMVLQYGLIGTALFAAQFVFGWRYARRNKRARANVASDTSETYLAYLAISSIATGSFVMFPEFALLLIAVLVAHDESGGGRNGFVPAYRFLSKATK